MCVGMDICLCLFGNVLIDCVGADWFLFGKLIFLLFQFQHRIEKTTRCVNDPFS